MLKQRVFLFLVIVLLAMAPLGCAGFAKLQSEDWSAQASLIPDLLVKWESYRIHAVIWPGNKIVALVFDLKSDDRTILADGWTKVDTYPDLASLVEWLQAGQAPVLFRVLGPDGSLFGYLYTSLPGVQTQVIDARTILFYPVKPPPSPGP
jgi:hypothetical protein